MPVVVNVTMEMAVTRMQSKLYACKTTQVEESMQRHSCFSFTQVHLEFVAHLLLCYFSRFNNCCVVFALAVVFCLVLRLHVWMQENVVCKCNCKCQFNCK